MAEEYVAPTVEELAEAHAAQVRQELAAAEEEKLAWNDLLAAAHQLENLGINTLIDAYAKAQRDKEEAIAAQKATEKALREAAVAAVATMTDIQDGKPFPAIEWLTTTNNKTFTVPNKKMLAEFLLQHGREDLIEIGGSVDDRMSLIKSGLLPTLEDGQAAMSMHIRPTLTIRDKVLREKIAANLREDGLIFNDLG